MWSLLVGIGIGALQVLGLFVFGKMILGENNMAKALGALLLLVKTALIVLVIVLIAQVSMMNVIWTAVGMLLGLIAALLYVNRRPQKHRGTTDGKESNDG